MKRFLQQVLKLMAGIQLMLYLALLIGPLVAIGSRVPDWPCRIPVKVALPLATLLLVAFLISLNMLIGGSLFRLQKRLERKGNE